MVIEIKERGKDSFYDEFLYVLSNYKAIIKNPNKKAHRLSYVTIELILVSFVMMIITGIISFSFNENELYKYILYFFYFLFVFSIFYFILIKKRIKALKNVNDIITLKFEDEYLEYLTSNNNYQVKWKAIKYIVINKYSICFIPIENNIPMIGVSIDYQQDTLKAIKEVKQEELIITNF